MQCLHGMTSCFFKQEFQCRILPYIKSHMEVMPVSVLWEGKGGGGDAKGGEGQGGEGQGGTGNRVRTRGVGLVHLIISKGCPLGYCCTLPTLRDRKSIQMNTRRSRRPRLNFGASSFTIYAVTARQLFFFPTAIATCGNPLSSKRRINACSPFPRAAQQWT